MGKTLIIAEKPSVARNIAAALGCGTKAKGFISGGNYIITWAVGHLAGLYEPEDYDDKYKKWSIKNLPIIPEQFKLKINPSTQEQYKVLNSLINSTEVDDLICATDPAREGELIFRYIYILSGTKKPFRRLWLKSMTTQAIGKAFENLKDGKDYNSIYNAGYSRNIADWLVGKNATRAFSLVFGETLPIGRVQTPTLNMIVQRELEIQNFKPKIYYCISGTFECKNEEFQAVYKQENGEKHINDREVAQKIYDSIRTHETWQVTEINATEESQAPPELYNLSELQKDCNRLLGYSAEKTLNIAQQLYEKSLISYPRTDSCYLPSDMATEVEKILRSLKNNYSIIQTLINDGLKLQNAIDDTQVTDHHAIIPQAVPQSLSDEEQLVYDRIVMRFITSFMEDYKYIKYVALIKNDEVNGFFETFWQLEQCSGWKAVYNVYRESIYLNIKKGEKVALKRANAHVNRTQPPPRYTDGTLIEALECAGRFVSDGEMKKQLKQKGLGTPATRAGIIEKLIKSEYVVRDLEKCSRVLKPTLKGINLIKYLDIFPDIKSVALTAKWEQVLGEIEQGIKTNGEFIAEIKKFVCGLVNHCENVLRGKKDENKYSGNTKQN